MSGQRLPGSLNPGHGATCPASTAAPSPADPHRPRETQGATATQAVTTLGPSHHTSGCSEWGSQCKWMRAELRGSGAVSGGRIGHSASSLKDACIIPSASPTTARFPFPTAFWAVTPRLWQRNKREGFPDPGQQLSCAAWVSQELRVSPADALAQRSTRPLGLVRQAARGRPTCISAGNGQRGCSVT